MRKSNLLSVNYAWIGSLINFSLLLRATQSAPISDGTDTQYKKV